MNATLRTTISCAVVVSSFAVPARAQQYDDAILYGNLNANAKEAQARGDWPRRYRLLQALEKMRPPPPNFWRAMAEAADKTGHYREALDAANRCEREADDDDLRKKCKEEVQTIEMRFGRVLLDLRAPPDDLTVVIGDGFTNWTVERAKWSTPQFVLPGKVRVTASAPTWEGFMREVEIKAGEPQTVVIERPAAQPPPPPAVQRTEGFVLEVDALVALSFTGYNSRELKFSLDTCVQVPYCYFYANSKGVGIMGGAHIFIGGAVNDGAHVGVRALASGGGSDIFVAVGPSFSGNVVGPLWLGFGPSAGAMWRSVNNTDMTINLTNDDSLMMNAAGPRSGTASSGFGIGVTGEIRLAGRVDPSTPDWPGKYSIGAVLLPSVLVGPGYTGYSLPVGFGVRFY